MKECFKIRYQSRTTVTNQLCPHYSNKIDRVIWSGFIARPWQLTYNYPTYTFVAAYSEEGYNREGGYNRVG